MPNFLFNTRRTSLLLSLILASAFVITNLTNYYFANSKINSHIETISLPMTADSLYSELKAELYRPILIAKHVTANTFLRDWAAAGEQDKQEVLAYLQQIKNEFDVGIQFISSNSYNYYHYSGVLKKVTVTDEKDAWFFRALKNSQDLIVNIDYATANTDELTLFIDQKLYDKKGGLLGFVSVSIKMSELTQILDVHQQQFQSTVYLVDRLGNVKVQGSNEHSLSHLQQVSGVQAHVRDLLTGYTQQLSYTEKGVEVFLTSRLLSVFDWMLIIKQEKNDAQLNLLDTLKLNIWFSILVAFMFLGLFYYSIERYHKKIKHVATTDRLTGVANRLVFDIVIEQALKVSLRRKESLSIILLDIDHFKQINDTYGHLCGDKVIKSIANIITQHVRASDLVCRWGGEEFLVLLPNCNTNQAFGIADKLNFHIEQTSHHYNNISINCTASIGIAEYRLNETMDDFIARADKALYAGKTSGRNKVMAAA